MYVGQERVGPREVGRAGWASDFAVRDRGWRLLKREVAITSTAFCLLIVLCCPSIVVTLRGVGPSLSQPEWGAVIIRVVLNRDGMLAVAASGEYVVVGAGCLRALVVVLQYEMELTKKQEVTSIPPVSRAERAAIQPLPVITDWLAMDLRSEFID